MHRLTRCELRIVQIWTENEGPDVFFGARSSHSEGLGHERTRQHECEYPHAALSGIFVSFMSHMNAENSFPTLCGAIITAVAWLHAVAAVWSCCTALREFIWVRLSYLLYQLPGSLTR